MNTAKTVKPASAIAGLHHPKQMGPAAGLHQPTQKPQVAGLHNPNQMAKVAGLIKYLVVLAWVLMSVAWLDMP